MFSHQQNVFLKHKCIKLVWVWTEKYLNTIQNYCFCTAIQHFLSWCWQILTKQMASRWLHVQDYGVLTPVTSVFWTKIQSKAKIQVRSSCFGAERRTGERGYRVQGQHKQLGWMDSTSVSLWCSGWQRRTCPRRHFILHHHHHLLLHLHSPALTLPHQQSSETRLFLSSTYIWSAP